MIDANNLVAGHDFSCAITRENKLVCWGGNSVLAEMPVFSGEILEVKYTLTKYRGEFEIGFSVQSIHP